MSPPLALTIQEAAQLARTAGMLEFAQGLGFDLADTFAGHAKLLTDLFEGVVSVHPDAETHTQDPLFARGQRGQNPRGGFAQIALDRRIDG